MKGWCSILALVSVALVALPSAVAGRTGNPQPLPPEAAAQAMSAPGRLVATAVKRVPLAAALAAGRQPGWTTEVETGLTPEQAVAAAAGVQSRHAGRGPLAARRAYPATICWSGYFAVEWGGWPYGQIVRHNAYWCGNGYTLSYRTQHVTLSADGICSYHDAYGFKLWGGVGTYSVGVRSGGSFDCPTTVPWLTSHSNNYFDTYLAADGGAYVYTVVP